MKRTRSILALLLILCLVLPMVPVRAAEAAPAVTAPEVTTPEASEARGVLEMEPDWKILHYVDPEDFYARGHIARFETEETLSSYVFLNADGSKTVYYMDEPVKFQDGGGRIWEKDLTLTAVDAGYTTMLNDVALTLPVDPASGIRLSHGTKQITLIPQGGTLKQAAAATDSSVTYPDYYGEGMSLRYTPTLSGVKEDILLDTYSGVNSFSFTLNTVGLNLYRAGNSYYLAESKLSTNRIEMGDIVAFDARGKFSIGTMTTETIMPGQSYRLTLTVDEAFLMDEDTVYPVVIDPTLTATDGTLNSSSIQDATVYSGSANLNTHDWTYHHIGYYDSTYGTGETVVRLSGLINSDVFTASDGDWFTEAKFCVYDASGISGQTVHLYPMVSNTTWKESSITWADKGSRRTTAVDSVTMSAESQGEFDILSLVQDWKNGDENPNAGFVLVADSQNTAISSLYSSEHSDKSKRPYFVVTYQNDVWINTDIAEMDAGATVTLTAGTKIQGDTVTWTSANTSIATVTPTGDYTCKVTGVRSGYTTIAATLPNGQSAECKVYVTITDGTYFIRHSSGLYMGVDQGVVTGSPVELLAKKSSGPAQLRQIWKIQHIERDIYSIRSVYRLDMSLNVTNSNSVDVAPLDTELTPKHTPGNRQWGIQRQGNTYTLRYAGTQALTLSTAEEAPTSGSDLSIISRDDFTWSLEWKSVSDQLLLINTQNGLPAQNALRSIQLWETARPDEMNLMVSVVSKHTNSQSVEWTSSNPDVANVYMNTGVVNANTRGRTTIIASNDRASNTVSYTMEVYEMIYVKNYCDDTLDDERKKLIPKAVDFLNHVYSDEFCLRFEMRWDAKPYHGAVDACERNGYDCTASTESNCSSSCSQHHKNVHRISDELYDLYFFPDNVVVSWSNSKKGVFCAEREIDNQYVHETIETDLALVTYDEVDGDRIFTPVVQVLTINQHKSIADDNASDLAFMSIILAHEIAHTLGMSDVYNNYYYEDAPHVSNNNVECIMESFCNINADVFYNNVVNGEVSALCDDCIRILKSEIPENVYELPEQ